MKNDPKIRIRQMNESLIRRLGWQKNETLTQRHGREVNGIGSALVARENRYDSFGYGSLDNFSRNLHRLRRGNRKDLFTSLIFAWLGLVRRECYSLHSNNYVFRV